MGGGGEGGVGGQGKGSCMWFELPKEGVPRLSGQLAQMWAQGVVVGVGVGAEG